MGNLTQDMTRLRGEVDSLRGARGALMHKLARGARGLTTTVSAMRADFGASHTAMANKTSAERHAFVSAMTREMSSLLEHFSRVRSDMARRGRKNRETFLLEMRRQVTDMRKETADDLTGACLAWRGKDLRKAREVKLKKEPEVAKPTPAPVKEAAAQKERETPPKAQLKATTEPPKVKAPAPVVRSMEPQKRRAEPSRKR